MLKLRPYDGIAIAVFLILPPLLSTGLSKLVEQNNSAAWIALLIAFFIMLCLFLVTALLIKRYEGRNIVEITSEVMGRPFGILYGIMLCVYFCFFTGVQIRESTELLKIYGLTFTPMAVVAVLILFAAVALNFLGGRSIVKSAGFFFVIIIAGIVFIMLLGLNRYNPDNLVPILGNGLPDLTLNGLFASSLFDSVIVLFLFAPAFSNIANMKKSGVTALVVAAIAYVLLSLCFIMMFSPAVGSSMTSGLIEMGKSIYYNHFFYRFEVILLIVLVVSAAMHASIGLFVARKSLSCAFKRTSPKSMTIICTIPVLFAIFLPSNILNLTQKYLPVTREYSMVFMAGFPLLVLIISSIKRIFKHEKD